MVRSSFFYFIVTILSLVARPASGQVVLSGIVFDSTRLYSIKGAQVISTGGNSVFTDSLGMYSIKVTEKDSVYFFYNNKPTQKFPVSGITNYTAFNISLRVRVSEKYKLLKEVVVYGHNHRQDSIENRAAYSSVFNYQKPGLYSVSDPGATTGFDLDQIINVFRFRRNKQHLRFQKRLIEQEEDNYVDYKFNPLLLRRITGLRGDTLTRYKNLYRPSYEFLSQCSELEFYQYILSTCYHFKKDEGIYPTEGKLP